MTSTQVFLLIIAAVHAAPVDEPIKVDLPVYDQPENTELVKPLDSEGNEDRSALAHKLHVVTHAIAGKLSPHSKAGAIGAGFGAFAPPVTSLEGAILESEGFGSQKLSIKENLQHIVAGLLQPKPIVDTIKEEEKYGNTGDKFYAAGRAVVGGAEGVSNLVNTVLEVPASIFKKITRTATEKLNNLGARLIGL